jgi:ABC-type transporter Mla subunit MlaD
MAYNLAMFEGPHRNRNIMIIVAVVVIAAVIVLYLTDRLPGIAEGTFVYSMTARATSTGTSNGGTLRRIAFRYCRNCRS